MEPRIQYARTNDGVNIAYWAMGEGPPLIHLSLYFTHIRLEWEILQVRDWYERLAVDRTLVRFDNRGMGLSGGTIAGGPLDFVERDLEAVTSRLGLERFALLGLGHSVPPAIAYAVANPDRVSDLLLWQGYSSADEWLLSPQVRAVRAMIGSDWEMLTETMAATAYGWSEGVAAQRFAALIRESITPEAYPEYIQAHNQFDVSGLLPQVRVPTLVMHRRESRIPVLSVARDLAARIPDSRFVLLEGTQPAPYLGDTGAVFDAIEEFLGSPKPEARDAPAPAPFRTVLFTDVQDSTALTDRLGDAAARDVLREHERITREALKAHGGSEVKTMGDGFLASFGSATKALECAVAIQIGFTDSDIRVRIGLNAGEPIAEDDPGGRSDLYGTAVIVAARIAAQAAGREILVSDVVRQLVAGKGFLFNDRGDHALKGFEDPVRVWEVRWRE